MDQYMKVWEIVREIMGMNTWNYRDEYMKVWKWIHETMKSMYMYMYMYGNEYMKV